MGNKRGVEARCQSEESQEKLCRSRRLNRWSRDVSIRAVLRSLSLGTGLSQRLQEGRRMDEGQVGREVQLKDVELRFVRRVLGTIMYKRLTSSFHTVGVNKLESKASAGAKAGSVKAGTGWPGKPALLLRCWRDLRI